MPRDNETVSKVLADSSADSHNTTDMAGSVMEYLVVSKEQLDALGDLFALTALTIALSGVVTNALTIRTFFRMGLQDGISVSFFALAITDLCYTLNTCVQSIAGICYAMEGKYGTRFGLVDPFAVLFLCVNVGMIIFNMTTFTTAFVAIARCMCIAMPLKFKGIFTLRKCLLTIITFAVCALSLHVPTLVNIGLRYDTNSSRLVMWVSKDREKIKDINRILSFFVLSAMSEIIVVVCVAVMTSKLRSSVRFRREQDAKTSDSSEKVSHKLTGKERSVALQVITICAIFIVCNLYRMVHSWAMMIDPRYDLGGSLHYLYMIISGFRTIVDCINSSVNFYVFTFFNIRFRSICFNLKRNDSVKEKT